MRVFGRKVGEQIIVDLREFGYGVLRIKVVKKNGATTQIGVAADDRLKVDREEVFWQREQKGGSPNAETKPSRTASAGSDCQASEAANGRDC